MGERPWWLWLFFGIGVLATASGFVTLFFALGRRPARMWTKQIGDVASDDFLRPLAALLSLPLREGGTAQLLNNGDAWLASLLSDIRSAQRSVTFMGYIWEPGRMSDQVFAALVERARAGVQVRVLLDGFGCLKCPKEGIEQLRAAGGRVATFRPLRIGKLSRFHKRNHRRAMVIDGRIGHTGGMAVGDKWLGDARTEEEWRDTMTRVDGCMAEHVQAAVTELWAYVTGEVLAGEAFFPTDAESAPTGVRSVGLVSAPSSDEHPLRLFFFLTFLAAQKRLWITTPYFVPDKHTRKVVADRARAGVDVRILLPNDHTDAKPIRRAGHSYFQELLDAGVRLYEYQPTMMHTKHAVVDGLWSVVGSANMDVRSKELNQENVLGILDADFAKQLDDTFLADLEKAEEIDPEQWRRRGIKARILERFFVFFAEQY